MMPDENLVSQLEEGFRSNFEEACHSDDPLIIVSDNSQANLLESSDAAANHDDGDNSVPEIQTISLASSLDDRQHPVIRTCNAITLP